MKKLLCAILIISIFISSFTVLNAAEPILKDISKHWAKNNITYLYNLRYIGGYPDGTYKPNNPVNVAEFLKLATLGLGYKLESGHFVWYENYVNKALEIRLIAEGEFPNMVAPLTREQVAKIAVLAVMNKEEKPSQEYDELIRANIKDFTKIDNLNKQYVIDAYRIGLMEGNPNALFNPKGTLTRAEMCTVVMRIMDKAKRKPFDPEDGHAIILYNTYSGMKYIISRPDKKEEIGLAYLMQNSMGKSKGWYDVIYSPSVDYICSGFFDSEKSFKQSDFNMRMSLHIDLGRNDNIVPTYSINVYDSSKVKDIHTEAMAEAFKYLFGQDYQKAIGVFNKYIEEGVHGTVKISDTNYTFNNRKVNIYRPDYSGGFVFNIYKKVK